jgi:hypothetical protein
VGQRLRQSFRTIATAAGVSEIDAKLLMNHAIPGVNAGYITRHKLLEKSSSRSTAGNKQSRVCAQRRFARQTFGDPELALRRCCATGGLGGKDRSKRSCSDGLKRSDGGPAGSVSWSGQRAEINLSIYLGSAKRRNKCLTACHLGSKFSGWQNWERRERTKLIYINRGGPICMTSFVLALLAQVSNLI